MQAGNDRKGVQCDSVNANCSTLCLCHSRLCMRGGVHTLELLGLEVPLIGSFSSHSQKDELAYLRAWEKSHRIIACIVYFKHLSVADAGVHEGGSDVNEQAESGKARAPLQYTAQARAECDLLLRDRKARLARAKYESLSFGYYYLLCYCFVVNMISDMQYIASRREVAKLIRERQINARTRKSTLAKWLYFDLPNCDGLEYLVFR
mmetsp:Transcript_45609/g.117883  ORF Transcript_45609/g.117883 Transcript_45609/m.117883 type:complete len:206 (-) Transcript_45609:686-1303(-)